MKRAQVCEVFDIHRTTLRRWQKRQEAGLLADVPPSGGARLLSPQDEDLLVAQLQRHPDATVDEHLLLWQQDERVLVSRATLGRAIRRVSWTRKKSA
jgi:transposase